MHYVGFPVSRMRQGASGVRHLNRKVLISSLRRVAKRHLDADGLSRCPMPTGQCSADYQYVSDNMAFLEKIDVALERHGESILEAIIKYLISPNTDISSGIKRRAAPFKVRDGFLYRRNYDPHNRQ